MASEYMFRVTVLSPSEGKRGETVTKEYRLRPPVNIGRSAENHVQIDNHFVSGNHARVEEIGRRVCVTDLGSRNGVHVEQGGERLRIAAQTPYEVSPNGFEFYLGSDIRVSVELEQAPGRHLLPSPPEVAPARRPRFSLSEPELSGLGDGLPALPDLGRPIRDLPPLDVPRAGFADEGGLSLPALPGRSAGREPDRPQPPARQQAPVRNFEPVKPAYGRRPDPAEQGHSLELKTGSFDLSLELLALQGLREIVASLTPGRTLDTRGDVARLVSRLHNTLEVVCRTFLALRDGHAKFLSGLHMQHSAQYDPARVALDTARDPAGVASHLLDFREEAPEPGQALEAILKELGVHQVALLDGLMQGIRALLEELSPESIAEEVENKRGMPRLGGGERALWKEYCARYQRFADDGEAFARVFGAEFTSAYRAYRRSHAPRR